jgi:hypothetical protein
MFTIPSVAIPDVTVLAAGKPPAGAGSACATLPGGLMDNLLALLGYVKGGVLIAVAFAFFLGVLMMLWGRFTHHPQGGRLGVTVLTVDFGAAILYAGGFAMLTAITGSSCGA